MEQDNRKSGVVVEEKPVQPKTELLAGRVYALGLLLKKEVVGFGQVAGLSAEQLASYLEDASQAPLLIQKRKALLRK